MDFTSDDPLDDLLRDTSADKFKSSLTAAPPMDLVSSSATAPLARKERKSALLAELFGTGSSTSGFALDDIRDQDASSSNKPTTSSLSDGYSRSDTRSDKPVGALSLSGNSNIFGEPADDKKLESFNFSSMRPSNAEPAERKDNDFIGLGGYVPSVGKVPTGSSLFSSKSRPTSSPNSLTQYQTTLPRSLNSANPISGDQDKASVSTFFSKSEPNSELSQTAKQQPKTLFQEEGANVLISQTQKFTPETATKSSSHPPVPQANVPIVDITILSGIKESLEKFSNTFCSKFETLTEKTARISEISYGLNELHKSLISISQSLMTASAQPNQSQVSPDVEKRLSNMESKLEKIHQENLNLRSQLEMVENQLLNSRNEVSKIKSEAEVTVENKIKCIKESVNYLDNKVNSQLSQLQIGANETIQSVKNIESLYSRIRDRLDEVERRQSEKAAKSYCEEVQLLLQNELKWLRQEKDKLKKNRKDNKIGLQEVHGKLNLLDHFTMELSRTVREHQFNLENADDRLRKLERIWSSLSDQNEEVAASKEKGRANQVEDIGLALWKLQVKSDEQKLIEQQNFLQYVSKSPI